MSRKDNSWVVLIGSAWLAACATEVEPSQHETLLTEDIAAAAACASVHAWAAARMSEVKTQAAEGCVTHDDCLLAFATTHCTAECTAGVPVARQNLLMLRHATADVDANICPGTDCSRVNTVCALAPEPETDGSTPGSRCVAGRCVLALVCNRSQCPTPAEGAACCDESERCGALIDGNCQALDPRR